MEEDDSEIIEPELSIDEINAKIELINYRIIDVWLDMYNDKQISMEELTQKINTKMSFDIKVPKKRTKLNKIKG